MKITLEPSANQRTKRDTECMNKTITLEHPSDDLMAHEALELVCSALIAWGFHPESIGTLLHKETADQFGYPHEEDDWDDDASPRVEDNYDQCCPSTKYVPPFEGDPDECKFTDDPPFGGGNPYHYVGIPPSETIGVPGESTCSTEDEDHPVVAKSTYSQADIPREITQEEAEDFCNNYGKEDDGLGDEHLADYIDEGRGERNA